MIPESDKPPNQVTSYQPLSLLPIMSKLFEKLLLVRLKTPVSEDKLIPDYQFGFRNNHLTTEKVTRVYNVIPNSIEEKKYCCAAFLDIQQAFAKVWHPGLLYKIKTILPRFFLLFESYLYNRRFYVQHGHDISECYPIKSGVPQERVLDQSYILCTLRESIRRDYLLFL